MAGFALSLSSQTGPEVKIIEDPTHHLSLQNQYVRVFSVEVPPGTSTRLHRHDHDYIYVNLGAVEISNEVAGKAPVTLKFRDGETRFSAGGFAHTVRDLAPTPFRNITVELLQDEQARKNPPPPWDEERALHVFDGGTQDIMFVKDGVRVSEIDLQPGGVIPLHQHPGPHLVVAVTDVKVRSDVPGKGSSIRELKAREIAWIPGGLRHTLTNVGKSNLMLITLEFHPEARGK